MCEVEQRSEVCIRVFKLSMQLFFGKFYDWKKKKKKKKNEIRIKSPLHNL